MSCQHFQICHDLKAKNKKQKKNDNKGATQLDPDLDLNYYSLSHMFLKTEGFIKMFPSSS